MIACSFWVTKGTFEEIASSAVFIPSHLGVSTNVLICKQDRRRAASAASTLVNNSQGSIPTPTPIPPVGIVAGVEIRRQANPKGGPQTKWRRVPSRGRVCSVVLQRAPLKRSIPSLALPRLPQATSHKLGAPPVHDDSSPQFPLPRDLPLAPM